MKSFYSYFISSISTKWLDINGMIYENIACQNQLDLFLTAFFILFFSSSDQDDSSSLPPSEHQSPASLNSYNGVDNNNSKGANKQMQNAVSLPHLHQEPELSLPNTKDKKGRKGKKKKDKKYDSVGESIPASSSQEKDLDTEPVSVPEHFEQNPCLLDSHGYPTSPRNAEDNLSLFEGWEIDLNLDTGSSMLDDVIGVMDKIEL